MLRIGLMAADAASSVVLFVLVAGFRFDYLDPNASWQVDGVGPVQLAAGYGLLWVAALWLLGLYRLRTHWSLRGEIEDVLRATVVAALSFFSVLYLFNLHNVSRLFVLLLLAVQPMLTVATRAVLRAVLGWMRSRGYNSRQMLVVGAGPQAFEFAREVERNSALGLRVLGHLAESSVSSRRPPIIGSIDEIEEILHTRVVDEVAICLPSAHWGEVEPITRMCEEEGKLVRVALQAEGGLLNGGRYEELGRTRLVTFLHGPDRIMAMAIKRIFDITVSATALLALSPVLLGISGYLLVREGRPLFFRQQRVGMHGRLFTCLKFRTMVRDAEERYMDLAHLSTVRGPAFKLDHDPRITGAGRFLRATSLDELPQLINVLRGEMSVVGPRPAPPREVANYSVWHRRRLAMRPGLTGIWQVEARDDADFDRRVQLDLHYIERWSLWMDVKIMLRTIPALVQQTGR